MRHHRIVAAGKTLQKVRKKSSPDEAKRSTENTLCALRDRSEADFREGRTVTWEDVKARNGL